MTTQILASDLATLVQDSKRKHPELRNAADKALQDLKALPVTSEAQVAADLSRRPHFISPFLLACGIQNAKFGSAGVAGLQRLAATRALPKERLTEVLEAFKGCLGLGPDVQLKILQALPSIHQNYAFELSGDTLSTTLQICSTLQNVKNPAVSNTAAATLQQLVIFVFDKVAAEDERALEVPIVTEIAGDSGPVALRPAAWDAYKVFHDLNMIINGEKPGLIRFSNIPLAAGLELVESVLSNHGRIMSSHPEQAKILRTLLMPMIIRSLSDRLTFPLTLRIVRILYLLLRHHLATMPAEFEISLGLLNHMLDPEASTIWKRALCLEVFRGLYADPRLVLEIYAQFDQGQGKRSILGDNLSAFVRLATEKPSVIGLGQHSTSPGSRGEIKDVASEQAAAEAGALAGVIGGPISDSNPIGISIHWSSIKTPCMEQLDKAQPPQIPETYIYSLVLTCVTNLSESLAKFILPLTVPSDEKTRRKAKAEEPSLGETSNAGPSESSTEGAAEHRGLSRAQSFRRKNIPINPLSLTNHGARPFVESASTLIQECWPAALATCSTFLNATLDTDYYRSLVRAIQKFTQVAGLLRLSTPRDAFLTALGKAAVPTHSLLAGISALKTPTVEQPGLSSNNKGLISVESLVAHASTLALDKARPSSYEAEGVGLTPRNLLCLRALLNIAIALGPTLGAAWSIIFEILQIADLIMASPRPQGGGRYEGGSKEELGIEKLESEVSAVHAAARRLFESTVDFPDESFVETLRALCCLLHPSAASSSVSRGVSSSAPAQVPHQRKLSNISGVSSSIGTSNRGFLFTLNKIGELVALNGSRFIQHDPDENGWTVLVSELVDCCGNGQNSEQVRLLAATTLSRTVKNLAQLSRIEELRNEMQVRLLSALKSQISVLNEPLGSESTSETRLKVHQIALETLKDVVEQCGESLIGGWELVFVILSSVFSPLHQRDTGTTTPSFGLDNVSGNPSHFISKQLARPAFGAVQLVCSDFLSAVPNSSLATLLDLLLKFCSQQDDLNVSLTAINFFWNVSDFLHDHHELSSRPDTFDILSDGPGGPDLALESLPDNRISVLWLQVLMNLSALTTDPRAELRSSAIQTVQRIFENYEDRMSTQAWLSHLCKVLFGMIKLNIAAQKSIRQSNITKEDEITAWNRTTGTLLACVTNLFTAILPKVKSVRTLGEAWQELLQYLNQFYDFGSHALGRPVFDVITGVLNGMKSSNYTLGPNQLLETAFTWRRYFDHRNQWAEVPEDNEDAFIAYVEAFRAIYELAGEDLHDHLLTMLRCLEQCIVDSRVTAYSSDVDHMTRLQAQVISSLYDVSSDRPGIPPYLIQLVGRFSVLPYVSKTGVSGTPRPSFVALSKESMSSLTQITIKHIDDATIYESGAFEFALCCLERSIQGKYIWKQQGKAPPLWQAATNSVLAILGPGLSYMRTHRLPGNVSEKIWNQIVSIARDITVARIADTRIPGLLESDERFDMEAYGKLRKLIALPLGSAEVPDALRRQYAYSLYETSLIHEPDSVVLLESAHNPLEGIYDLRCGYTNDMRLSLRANMAYMCFSELLSMVSAKGGTAEEVKLSQAAAPYLILRVALPLKAYIADQPLRGRMPAPDSQRRELRFVLREMKKLKSEPRAIPNAPGVSSQYRKHLHRLYPLLVQAMGVAKYDEEGVLDELTAIMEIVGAEFGVQDE